MTEIIKPRTAQLTPSELEKLADDADNEVYGYVYDAPETTRHESPFRGGLRDNMGGYGKQRDVRSPLTIGSSAHGTKQVDR